VVSGDYDEDGHVDLVVVNGTISGCGATSPDVVLFRGQANGTFLAGEVVFQQRADDAATSDLDGDGHMDVLAGTRILLGKGDGTFTNAGTVTTGGNRRVVVGDINGDGAPDVVSTATDAVWVALNLNDGSGNFETGSPFAVESVSGISVSDLDLDARDDVVAVSGGGGTVQVLLAQAGGSLVLDQIIPLPSTPPIAPDPKAVQIGDWNKDGFPDIAVVNNNRDSTDGSIQDGTLAILIQDVTAPLTVGTTFLPNGDVGFDYRVCLEARGGVGPYTWGLISGVLPDGLTLDSVAGSVQGVPTLDGASQLTVRVQDSSMSTADQILILTIGVLAVIVPAMSSWGFAAAILFLIAAGVLVSLRRAAVQR
jgi:hypothetical protein